MVVVQTSVDSNGIVTPLQSLKVMQRTASYEICRGRVLAISLLPIAKQIMSFVFLDCKLNSFCLPGGQSI